jgi:hypothetical protein
MKKWLIGLAVVAGLAMGTTTDAASVHLKGGKNAVPATADNGLTLTGSGSLTGLGNGDVLVSITAQADVTATCTNPAGQTQPPGQNPAAITVSGSVSIPASEVKNGNVAFSVTTIAPDPIIAGAPGCPNPQWTERIEDLTFTSFVITVEQPPGTVVLVLSCTTNPTSCT